MSTLESDTELETSSAFSDTSSTSTLTGKHSKNREELPLITDPHKLEQRQKQLDYGKNTEGYKNYIKLWSKFSRRPGMPQTPDKTIGYSHRRWLGLMTKWRKALHKWDTLDNAPAPKSKVRIFIQVCMYNIPMHLLSRSSIFIWKMPTPSLPYH